MSTEHNFEHLWLKAKFRRPAKMGLPPARTDETRANKLSREDHSAILVSSVEKSVQAARARRAAAARPDTLPAGIPVLLRIDPNENLDELAARFEFEIISEQDDGVVVFASSDVDLQAFLDAVRGFATQELGTAIVGSVHQFFDDASQDERLRRILSDAILKLWPALSSIPSLVIDIGVVCVGSRSVPPYPERGLRMTDAQWADVEFAWSQTRRDIYAEWEALKDIREAEVRSMVRAYGGTIVTAYDTLGAFLELPDSFTVRLRLSGDALRDIVLNYPFIFEAVEVEPIETDQYRHQGEAPERRVQLIKPPADAPAVCVIDSGIQETHPLLEEAIDRETSRCFLPAVDARDVGDYVERGGHGTRVAGAVLYGRDVPSEGNYVGSYWIQNARVLDRTCRMPESLPPPAATRAAVLHFHEGPRRTRIFNQSINTEGPCRQRHMSAWAAELDLLSAQHDVLIIQSVGNVPLSEASGLPNLQQYQRSDMAYPTYLRQGGVRIANPAQSLHALAVGSIAKATFRSESWRTFARKPGDLSAFSRTGFGLWGSIKPDVVEFGGDAVVSVDDPTTVAQGGLIPECCPLLVRSTLGEPGPLVNREIAGTSYAAPLVANIAAELQSLVPNGTAQLYRALIVQSARWPEGDWFSDADQKKELLRRIGYLRHQCEYLVWGTRGPCPAATHAGPFPGCYSIPVDRKDKHHLTGKPTLLLRELVKIIPPHGRILDPFAGSGTALVAAALETRQAVGIEREAEYCQIAIDRLTGRQRLSKASHRDGTHLNDLAV